MTARDFCYWLQGFYELQGDAKLSDGQIKVVRRRLEAAIKYEDFHDCGHGVMATEMEGE